MHLDSDLLRTFVAVADMENFTKAAGVVGRTQSAVSLQIKRLEDMVGTPWRKPPFVKSVALRWTLILGTVAYLIAAFATIEVDWARVYIGLDRGWQFILGFTNPDFTSRGKDIWEGLLESIVMTVAAGAFASCTPLVGFHFILSFVLAWVIGGSMIAAAIGTAVGNPLTFPLIWVTSFQVGELILGANPAAAQPHEVHLSIDLITTSIATFWPTLKPMLLGGFVIGSVLGGTLYMLVRSAVIVSQTLRAERLAAHAARVQAERAAAADDKLDA